MDVPPITSNIGVLGHDAVPTPSHLPFEGAPPVDSAARNASVDSDESIVPLARNASDNFDAPPVGSVMESASDPSDESCECLAQAASAYVDIPPVGSMTDKIPTSEPSDGSIE